MTGFSLGSLLIIGETWFLPNVTFLAQIGCSYLRMPLNQDFFFPIWIIDQESVTWVDMILDSCLTPQLKGNFKHGFVWTEMWLYPQERSDWRWNYLASRVRSQGGFLWLGHDSVFSTCRPQDSAGFCAEMLLPVLRRYNLHRRDMQTIRDK